MNEIRLANPNAFTYLNERDPKTWCRAFFEINRGCEAVENGFSECFNSVILKVRNKPIITMLKAIRVIIMERMHNMRRISDNWVDDICPSYRKKLELAKHNQRYWNVVPGGGSKFEVRRGHDAFIVDEETRSCTCRMWELCGVPCEHSVAAIFFIHKNPDQYMAAWFRKEMYREAYNTHILPVKGMNQWPPNELNKPLPPKPRKMPGRPKKKRKRAVHEPQSHSGRISKVGIAMTCKYCGQEGHNRRSCKNNPLAKVANAPSKKVGRPSKVDKGKGVAACSSKADKGKGVAECSSKVDKGKGVAACSTVGKAQGTPRPSIGGFMSDARRTYDTGAGQVKKKKLPKLIPRRRESERLKKVGKKITGEGSSKDQAMEIE